MTYARRLANANYTSQAFVNVQMLNNGQTTRMDIQTIRINNLKAKIAETSDSNADFARKFNLDASYISQVINKHRGFGEKAARTFEEKAGLMPGELDLPPDEKQAQGQLYSIFKSLDREHQQRVLEAALAYRALEKTQGRE